MPYNPHQTGTHRTHALAGAAPELSHAFSGLGFDAPPKPQQAAPLGQNPKPVEFNSFEAFPGPFEGPASAPPAGGPTFPPSQGGFGAPPPAAGFEDYDPFAPTAAPANGARTVGAPAFPGAFGAASAMPNAEPILPGSHPVPHRAPQVRP